MLKKFVLTLVLAGLCGLTPEASGSDLQQIADALDVSTTKTFQFTANGTMYNLGQNVNPAGPWPRFFVKSFTRMYDFTAGAMRDQIVRMTAEGATLGPEQQVNIAVSGD
ncbi:MAG TPA: hypothetical protein VJQ55_04400, partial [Candidatus Binatia bacterium]|nr:hypothetical protein [Candidatus Binatia bacterium]